VGGDGLEEVTFEPVIGKPEVSVGEGAVGTAGAESKLE
jgi:hypothetical protein